MFFDKTQFISPNEALDTFSRPLSNIPKSPTEYLLENPTDDDYLYFNTSIKNNSFIPKCQRSRCNSLSSTTTSTTTKVSTIDKFLEEGSCWSAPPTFTTNIFDNIFSSSGSSTNNSVFNDDLLSSSDDEINFFNNKQHKQLKRSCSSWSSPSRLCFREKRQRINNEEDLTHHIFKHNNNEINQNLVLSKKQQKDQNLIKIDSNECICLNENKLISEAQQSIYENKENKLSNIIFDNNDDKMSTTESLSDSDDDEQHNSKIKNSLSMINSQEQQRRSSKVFLAYETTTKYLPTSKSDSQLIWYHAPAPKMHSKAIEATTNTNSSKITHSLTSDNFFNPIKQTKSVKYRKSKSFQTNCLNNEALKRYSMPTTTNLWNFTALMENDADENENTKINKNKETSLNKDISTKTNEINKEVLF